MSCTTNKALNQVLIGLDKSLLSYVAEAWPWSGKEEAAARQTFTELEATRREHVQRLADYLLDHGWPIDFGGYPTIYTDLHFVAFDYLLSQIIDDQKQKLAEIEQAVSSCSAADSSELLKSILAGERTVLTRLEELNRSRTAVAAS